MKLQKPLFLLMLMVSLCLSAQGGTIFSQQFREDGVTFDRMEIMAPLGSVLTATDGGTLVSPRYEIWSFPTAISEYYFFITGEASGPATVSFFAFNGPALLDSANIYFGGNGSFESIGPLDAATYQDIRSAATVPEPGTFGVMGAGLLGIGFVIRRLRRL